MKGTLIIGVATLIVGSGLAPDGAPAQQPGTRRTDLQRHDLSAPGREVVQVRVDFDPGYVSPRHTHPGEEIIYVLEGTLEYRVEGQPPTTYKAGDVLFVPAGTIHAVTNVGSGNGAELATYVVQKGKPLITLAAPGAMAQASADPARLQWQVPPVLPPGALIAVVSGDPTGPGESTLLLSMPNGYRIPPHYHPSYEHVEVRDGTLLVGMGDRIDPKQTRALIVGDSAMDQEAQCQQHVP